MTKAEWNDYMRKYKPYKYRNLQVLLRFGKDDDIIKRLERVDNRSEYVRELIRKDMKEADDEGDSVPELRQGV